MCFPTRDDSPEGCAALLNAVPVYFQFLESFFINEVSSTAAVHEHFSEPIAVHNWTKDQCGWCLGCSEFRFVTGIEGDSRVSPWIHCCHLEDFGKAAECSLAPII